MSPISPEENTKPENSDSHGVVRFGLLLLRCATVAVTMATLLGLLARLHWRLELFCHFRVQYAAILLILSGLLLLARQIKWAAVAIIMLAFNLACVLPVYIGNSPQNDSNFALRTVQFNVYAHNRNRQEVLDFLKEANADVILLLEVTPDWEIDLEPLSEDFPFSCIEAQKGNFGIALFSRFPLIDTVTLAGPSRSFLTDVEVGDRRITVIGTHPWPPRSVEMARGRNDQLQELAALAANESDPVILMGDLNITPWSPYFGNLLQESKLKDSRVGFGIHPTWPSFLATMRIPIDHCLVSQSIDVKNRHVGPDLGSDHYPVICELAIPAAE